MHRRQFLAAVGSAGVVTTAGCTTPGASTTLSDPTVHTESPGRGSIEWTADGESVGELGVSGTVSGESVDLSTEINHSEGTRLQSIRLRLWMPQTATETSAEVAVVSPVEGDSSPPPSLSLYTPDRAPGTVIEVTDLDDLADETISTLAFILRPAAETATTLAIDATLALTSSAWATSDYTLDGQFELAFPDLTNQ